MSAVPTDLSPQQELPLEAPAPEKRPRARVRILGPLSQVQREGFAHLLDDGFSAGEEAADPDAADRHGPQLW